MNTNRLRYIHVAAAIFGAGLTLIVLLAALAGAHTRAAPPPSPTDDGPCIEAITVTSNLAISDTHPGAATNKTVYFSNTVPGIITLTFEISGTPPLTLTAGAAFSDPECIYTATSSPLITDVVYTVSTSHGSQNGVAYTAADSITTPVTVAITYVRDVTAPPASISSPPSGYFTATQLIVTGTATDGDGAGVRRVQVMTGTTWVPAAGATNWVYTTTVPITDGRLYTLSARGEDHLGIIQNPAATRVITVDNVRPANPVLITTTNGTATGTWIATSTVPVTWSLVADGSGATYYYAWTTSSTATVGGGDLSTTIPPVTGMNLSEGDNWFHLRTRDGAGNWATNTAHLGPFKVDTVPPTVSISTPAPGAVLTTVLSSIPITGTAEDGTSGLCLVQVATGTGWVTADMGNPWFYTWTLPSTDNVVYTLVARAYDNADNVGTSSDVTVTVDTVAPTVAVPLDAGEWSITSTLVFTWMPSDDAAGIAGYYVVITDSDGITVVLDAFTTATAYTITAGEGVTDGVAYYARVKARDANGNIGDYGGTSDGVIPDLTEPVVSYGIPPIYAVGNWLSATGSTVFYSNTMVVDQIFRVQGHAADDLSGPGTVTATPALNTPDPSNGGNWSSWHFDYAVANGMAESGHITVTVRDLIGNPATVAFTYTFDGAPPYANSVVINDGAEFATSEQVTLTLFSDDLGCGVDEMCINDTGAACAVWEWESYDTEKLWTLESGDGVKTVYVWFRDHLHNTSIVYSDTITLDTLSPTSTATSPDYDNADPILVTYIANDERSGIATVALWYKFGAGIWTDSEQRQTGTSGTFVFSPIHGDGVYYFQTIATDKAGNVEHGPSGNGDDSTTYDATPPISTLTSPEYTNVAPIPVSYTAYGEVAGVYIVALWYKFDGGIWMDSQQRRIGDTGTFFFNPPHGDGIYCFQTIATDNAGNVEHGPSGDGGDCTTYDTIPPTSEATSPEYATSSPIPVAWVATDTHSGVYSITLWYKQEITGTWTPTLTTEIEPQTTSVVSGTFEFYPPQGEGPFDDNGLYLFATVAVDSAGNQEAGPTISETQTLYDTQVPQSKAACLPRYWSSPSITVTWVATPFLASLTEVRLWYRFDAEPWTMTSMTSAATLGAFSFIPTEGSGAYYFATVAQDEYEKSEADPYDSGDTSAIYDGIPPTSTATSPAYVNTGAIPVTYTASDQLSGIAMVTLWYKFGAGGWTDSGQSLTGTMGIFTFTPPSGDGAYYFQTIATDKAGNGEGVPSGNGDDLTIYDTIPPTVTITAPEHISATQFLVSWSAQDAASGVVSYAVAYSGTIYADWQDWLTSTTDISATFPVSMTETDYVFRVTAYDRAGNSAYAETVVHVGVFRIYAPLILRNYPSQPEGSVVIQDGAACVHQQSVTLSLTATVEADTVTEMRLRNEDAAWGNGWETFITTRYWTLAGGISGLRTVYAQFRGSEGGVSGLTSDTVYLAWNGGFEDGWLPWQRDGELDRSLTQDQVHAGQWAALLGGPDYPDDNVPIGSARIWQTFSVPSSGDPEITLWYHIYTRDVVWGSNTHKYYDSFEIYINTVDWSEANNPDPDDPWRKTRCRDNLGDPDASNPGLVFCDGGTGPGGGKLDDWESSVTLDLSQFKGQNITLYLADFNRQDHSFNTWTYVDDICVNW